MNFGNDDYICLFSINCDFWTLQCSNFTNSAYFSNSISNAKSSPATVQKKTGSNNDFTCKNKAAQYSNVDLKLKFQL